LIYLSYQAILALTSLAENPEDSPARAGWILFSGNFRIPKLPCPGPPLHCSQENKPLPLKSRMLGRILARLLSHPSSLLCYKLTSCAQPSTSTRSKRVYRNEIYIILMHTPNSLPQAPTYRGARTPKLCKYNAHSRNPGRLGGLR
jgi:hypothetical protein